MPWDPPDERRVKFSRRAFAVAVMAAAVGWRIREAHGWNPSLMQSTMDARFGPAGVQRLQAWHSMLEQQAGRPEQEQLVAINKFWNEKILGSTDMQVWKEVDFWATPLETLGKQAADCEDFVIGKYVSLLRVGVAEEKLRFIYVRARMGGLGSTQSVAHMVLGYYATPVAEPLVMDNLVPRVQPASQRVDLTPVFSFNAQGVYVPGTKPTTVERINRWQELMLRMKQQGVWP